MAKICHPACDTTLGELEAQVESGEGGPAVANPKKRVPQAESMRRLADFRFEWVLPGHGQRVHLPAHEMRAEVLRLADEMRNGER